LTSAGHDVVSAHDQLPGATDDELISRAFVESRIVVTNDKDFGEKVFRERWPHCGVILLRLHNERVANKVDALGRLLARFGERLSHHFVVVTESQVRFARLPDDGPQKPR
jgi:predicted nuclease of predicted toxin-antitoxin system